MDELGLSIDRNQAVFTAEEKPCDTNQELLQSDAALEVLTNFIRHLQKHNSKLLQIFPEELASTAASEAARKLRPTLVRLLEKPLEEVGPNSPLGERILSKRSQFHQFIEKLYDFWREYQRFLIQTTGKMYEEREDRPYLTFNRHLDELTELVRSTYRDIAENITGDHPIIYRQVAAGFEVGLVVDPQNIPYPEPYREKLASIPTIDQVTIEPPLVFDPPMNKRTGRFQEVDLNPLDEASIDPSEWLCYPAQVGDIRIDVFYHKKFIDLGSSLANLFDLVTGDNLKERPSAVYMYGLDPEDMADFGDLPTVFYHDERNDMLFGAVPREDRFGYFGYVKKMMLTLHNIQIMKKGRIPIHGAITRISLQSGEEANIAIVGDSGAGKSETLEAFRILGEELIQDVDIICDDMGSLDVDPQGNVLAYGTEKGAFVRLDDLQQGYAFSQLDRSIFMSPQKTNARALMPVTPMETVLEGVPINYFLYANNYEEIDEEHPIIEKFKDPSEAKSVFREGARMSKGTTSEKGLVHAYFANPFGPPQFRELHEGLADRYFKELFETGVFVGEMRTRLGIEGYERKGPEKAARALLDLIKKENPAGKQA